MTPRPPGAAGPLARRLPLAGPDRQAVIAALRARLVQLDGRAPLPGRRRALSLGLATLDRALPWGGLPRGCLHEVIAAAAGGALADGAAAGFCAALLGRLARDGPVLWIAPRDDLFAPGLAELGLPPTRLLVVRARRRAEVLWALEEALHTPALAAALAEVGGATLTQTRRLQLAAGGSGATGLLLRRDGGGGEAPPPSAAVTRWRVDAAPSRGDGGGHPSGPGAPRWRVELVRCRGGGAAGAWTVEWRGDDGRVVDDADAGTAGALPGAAAPGDRPPRPARAGGRRR